MRNSLYFIGLASLIISCGSQKVIAKPNNLPQPTTSTIPKPPKPEIKHDVHGDYFTVNIADPTKNDNTISYGSLVGAKLWDAKHNQCVIIVIHWTLEGNTRI